MLKLLCLAALMATSIHAQSNSGAIQGAVRDAHDAVIPGATVTVANIATGIAKSIPATSAGE